MTKIQSLTLTLIKKRQQFFRFKTDALKLQKSFPEVKVTFEKTEIDPWLMCPLKDCQHLTILNIFEEEDVLFWNKRNPRATEHQYWKRLKNYEEGDGYIEQKIRGYYTMYHMVKEQGFDDNLIHQNPPFVCDLENVTTPTDHKIARKSAKGYYRQDGHHRSDIAKFLKISLPVTIAKFKCHS